MIYFFNNKDLDGDKMKKKIIIISLVGLFLDQLIKFFVVKYLSSVTIIPGFFTLFYAENNGVAFSMLNGNGLLIIMLSFLLIGFLYYLLDKEYLSKKHDNLFKDVTFGLLFGGILGNLTDRLIRGTVIDYVSLNFFGYHFPVFNLADVLITVGVGLMILDCFISDGRVKDKSL